MYLSFCFSFFLFSSHFWWRTEQDHWSMDKSERSSRSSHNSICNLNFSHGYSIPPPHAHSLINKRDDSLGRNTEIKTQNNISCVTIEPETPDIPSLPISNKIVDTSPNEHEIKFTQVEGCTPFTCVCVFFAILLISIGASSGIYFGSKFNF